MSLAAAPEFDTLAQTTALSLNLPVRGVAAVLSLSAEGATVPFLARYRKEATGGLDESQIRAVLAEAERREALEKRRQAIRGSLEERGLWEGDLAASVLACATLSELEALYAPYKQKRQTRAEAARLAGWGPLADRAPRLDPRAWQKALDEAVQAGLGTAQDGLEAVADILAEALSHRAELRARLREQVARQALLTSRGRGTEAERAQSVYALYWDFQAPARQLKPHQWFALQRGAAEKVLKLSWNLGDAAALAWLARQVPAPNPALERARSEAWSRLLAPAYERELERDLSEAAEAAGIRTFAENLRPLLLQAPLKGRRLLALDPGLRTGAKGAVLDGQGEVLDTFVLYPHRPEEALDRLKALWSRWSPELAVIGNGTGRDEAVDLVLQLFESGVKGQYTIVAEDGASVYSASELAAAELPRLDVTLRGAVSLGRRILDPLSELVKVEPRSLGVGLYQHDLPEKPLIQALDGVVEDVVNQVGVNPNTAGVPLLARVSGLGPVLAARVAEHRRSQGPFRSRRDLLKVPGLGPKTFEQCAGFLKLPDSEEPLDNTWIHPENYALARDLAAFRRRGAEPQGEERRSLAARHGVGEATLTAVWAELERPNRSPRDEAPLPPLYGSRLRFEDLREGQILPGLVKNLVPFGAFIDLGLKETALVHISQLADRYIKDPSEVLQVGQTRDFKILTLEPERRRIALTLR